MSHTYARKKILWQLYNREEINNSGNILFFYPYNIIIPCEDDILEDSGFYNKEVDFYKKQQAILIDSLLGKHRSDLLIFDINSTKNDFNFNWEQ